MIPPCSTRSRPDIHPVGRMRHPNTHIPGSSNPGIRSKHAHPSHRVDGYSDGRLADPPDDAGVAREAWSSRVMSSGPASPGAKPPPSPRVSNTSPSPPTCEIRKSTPLIPACSSQHPHVSHDALNSSPGRASSRTPAISLLRRGSNNRAWNWPSQSAAFTLAATSSGTH